MIDNYAINGKQFISGDEIESFKKNSFIYFILESFLMIR